MEGRRSDSSKAQHTISSQVYASTFIIDSFFIFFENRAVPILEFFVSFPMVFECLHVCHLITCT